MDANACLREFPIIHSFACRSLDAALTSIHQTMPEAISVLEASILSYKDNIPYDRNRRFIKPYKAANIYTNTTQSPFPTCSTLTSLTTSPSPFFPCPNPHSRVLKISLASQYTNPPYLNRSSCVLTQYLAPLCLYNCSPLATPNVVCQFSDQLSLSPCSSASVEKAGVLWCRKDWRAGVEVCRPCGE
jgi:hypothetical protein